MPVCFQLYRKGQTEPLAFQVIDDEMREHFKAPPDPVNYYERWYDTIGLGLACGHDWEMIKAFFPAKAAIIDWMAERFSADAWREPKH